MNDQTEPPVLVATALSRHFSEGGRTLEVLRDIELTIEAGERIAIIGASGSGKSTLLQLLGGLDNPTAGKVVIGGRDLAGLDAAERGRLRNKMVGFVYQFHHLLPEFDAVENVALPLLVRREPVASARQKSQALLTRVGLGERFTHKPSQLSGGERQRAAVARALITSPALVLADEPTGNLDGKTGDRVFELMLELNREFGTSLVVVTHDPAIARRMDRILTLEDGKLGLSSS